MSPSPVIDVTEVAVRPEPGDNVAIVSRDLDRRDPAALGEDVVTLPHTAARGPPLRGRAGEPRGDAHSPGPRRSPAPPRPPAPATTSAPRAAWPRCHGPRGRPGLPDEPTADNVSLDPYELDESTLHFGRAGRAGAAARARSSVTPGRGARPAPATTSWSSAATSRSSALRHRAGPPAGDGRGRRASTASYRSRTPRRRRTTARTTSTSCSPRSPASLLNPNVGAVLLVDDRGRRGDRPDDAPLHARARLPARSRCRTRSSPAGPASRTTSRRPRRSSSRGSRRWPPSSAREQPLADLRIGLQCGGSDAFSGISAQPAGRPGRRGGDPPRRRGEPRRDRRADRRRGLRAGERPRPRRRPRFLREIERLQGAGRLARRTPPRATRPAATCTAASTTSR